MGRRRRAVEQASRRQAITDRVVVGVLVVVAASGLMSLLPAYSQGVVSRAACRAASFGLGDCGRSSVEAELATTQLGPARCPALSALDAILPQVRTRPLVSDHGLTLQISQARNGDVWVWSDDPAGSEPPSLLDGRSRHRRELLPGVSVAEHTTWWLPRGQGLDALVAGLARQHRRHVTDRSALALTDAVFARSDAEVPPPTLATSQVQLDRGTLPGATPRPTATRPGKLTVDRDSPASLVSNSITGHTSLVADLRGGDDDPRGVLRVDRDAAGAVTGVVVGLIDRSRLAAGEAASSRGPGVAYVAIAVGSAAERRLVDAWLSDPSGFGVDAALLTGLAAAAPSDRLGTFLARAAAVTVLRYDGGRPADLARQVRSELEQQRRTDWTGARLQSVGAAAARPSGGTRTLVQDPSCLR